MWRKRFISFTLLSVAVHEFCALHVQVDLVHFNLQPAEGAIRPSHQQALSWPVPRGSGWVKSPQVERLSPAEGSDATHLGLHVAVRAYPVKTRVILCENFIDEASHIMLVLDRRKKKGRKEEKSIYVLRSITRFEKSQTSL